MRSRAILCILALLFVTFEAPAAATRPAASLAYVVETGADGTIGVTFISDATTVSVRYVDGTRHRSATLKVVLGGAHAVLPAGSTEVVARANATKGLKAGAWISLARPVVDTGQVTAWDQAGAALSGPPDPTGDYYGADAHFAGTQPSYTVSRRGLTVTDQNTGLTWTKSLGRDRTVDNYAPAAAANTDHRFTYDEAVAYVAKLNRRRFGGYGDWRLPSARELLSIAAFTGDAPTKRPFLDAATFDWIDVTTTAAGAGDEMGQVWSSTRYVGAVMDGREGYFTFNFADGHLEAATTGRSSDGLTGGGTAAAHLVRAVRGPVYGTNSFVDEGDGTVTDSSTGLMWAKADSGAGMEWKAALDWVRRKNSERHLGHGDWRLPNVKELQAIVDYTRAPDAVTGRGTQGAAIAPVFDTTSIGSSDSNTEYPWFWTSTTDAEERSHDCAYYVCFGRATSVVTNPQTGARVNSHGAGAVRADPKSGRLSDWAAGRGPSPADEVRIRNFVRLVRDAAGEDPVQPPGPKMNIAQTISDGAQRTTLAFSGLAMITGNLEAQSFFPPGKVADYTGFQYLRDNDPDSMGHNTSFLTRVANNVIYVLNDAQFAQLKTRATAQIAQIDLYGYKRFPLMKAFRRVLDGDIPAGSAGLNLNAVKKASRDLYLIDGQISFDRALLYAQILNSMDAAQKAYLDAMKGKGWNSWPDITNEQVRAKMAGLPQGTSVAVMTYASDLFSWYAGSVEADVYFCPERQGTYYGGFYIKDAPAIGHEGYGIDEQLTATAGSALCDSAKGYVTPQQAAVMSSLVDVQRDNLYASPTANIVKIRTEIATLLRGLMTSTADADAVEAQVLDLSGVYGELDGENNHAYVTVFAQVYASLTSGQMDKLMELRSSIMSGTYSDGTPFDFTVCTTPFLYSAVIRDVSVLAPYIDDTDYLFFEP